MLSCLKATELIEKRFMVKLSLTDKIRLKMHTSVCKACKNYEKQSQAIHFAITKLKEEQDEETRRLISDIKEKIKNSD